MRSKPRMSRRVANEARKVSKIDERLETVRGLLDSGVADARTRADNAQSSANAAQSSANAAQTSANAAQTRADNAYARTSGIARAQMSANAIGTAELASGSTDNLRAVTGAHMVSDILAARHFPASLLPSAVGVTVNNIVDGHVTTAKLADLGTTRAKIANDAVNRAKIDLVDLYIALDGRYARL